VCNREIEWWPSDFTEILYQPNAKDALYQFLYRIEECLEIFGASLLGDTFQRPRREFVVQRNRYRPLLVRIRILIAEFDVAPGLIDFSETPLPERFHDLLSGVGSPRH
jgi:hypothetical protein